MVTVEKTRTNGATRGVGTGGITIASRVVEWGMEHGYSRTIAEVRSLQQAYKESRQPKTGYEGHTEDALMQILQKQEERISKIRNELLRRQSQI